MQHLRSIEPVLDKWGYAILAGIIGMATASGSGGVSANAGFAIGFFSVFLSLIWLEAKVQKIRLKRQVDSEHQVIARSEISCNPSESQNQTEAVLPDSPIDSHKYGLNGHAANWVKVVIEQSTYEPTAPC
jgi:hypothetical protein